MLIFVPEQQGVRLSASLAYANQKVMTDRRQLQVAGVTQGGFEIQASANCRRIPQEFLHGKYQQLLREGLLQIAEPPLPSKTLVYDVNVVSPELSLGMVYDDQGVYDRVWYPAQLKSNKKIEVLVPFVRDANPDLAQLRLHLSGRTVTNVVPRTAVAPSLLPRLREPMHEFWLYNAFVRVPTCVKLTSKEPVAAPRGF